MKILHQEEWYQIGSMDEKMSPLNFEEQTHVVVSQCPDEWKRIACVEKGLFRLHKEDGRFLDAYGLTSEQVAAIQAWGAEMGYLEEKEVHRYLFTDEDGDDVFIECYSRREWEEEIDWDIMSPEHRTYYETDCLKVVRCFIATEKLRKAEGWTQEVCPSDVGDKLILMRYADEVLDVDGVFFADMMSAPWSSAPWAGILRRRLHLWSVEPKSS